METLPVANFVDAVLNLVAAIRSALELAAAAAIHLAGVVVGAGTREEGGVVVDALLAASQACGSRVASKKSDIVAIWNELCLTRYGGNVNRDRGEDQD